MFNADPIIKQYRLGRAAPRRAFPPRSPAAGIAGIPR